MADHGLFLLLHAIGTVNDIQKIHLYLEVKKLFFCFSFHWIFAMKFCTNYGHVYFYHGKPRAIANKLILFNYVQIILVVYTKLFEVVCQKIRLWLFVEPIIADASGTGMVYWVVTLVNCDIFII